MPETGRYFLDCDDDGHWYLVSAAHTADWHAWLALPHDDEASWETPAFAVELNGPPNLVMFTDPELGGQTLAPHVL